MFTATVPYDTDRLRWTNEKEKAPRSGHPESPIGAKKTENWEANSTTAKKYATTQTNRRGGKTKRALETRRSNVSTPIRPFDWFLTSAFLVVFVIFLAVVVTNCGFISVRARPQIQLSEEQKEYRALLQKDWARYQRQQQLELHRVCLRIQQSQNKALNELRGESEELYQAAIQPIDILLPTTLNGPVHTPPIKNYDVPAEYLFPLEPTIAIIKLLKWATASNKQKKNLENPIPRRMLACSSLVNRALH